MKKVLLSIAALFAVVVLAGGSAYAATHYFGHTTVKRVVVTHTVTPKPVKKVQHHKHHHAAPVQNAAPAVIPTPALQSGPVWTNCNPGTAYFVMANANTSCPFAMNVANAVSQHGYGVSEVYSPVTGQAYAMDAEPYDTGNGTAIMATAVDGNAQVELYVTVAGGGVEPPSIP